MTSGPGTGFGLPTPGLITGTHAGETQGLPVWVGRKSVSSQSLPVQNFLPEVPCDMRAGVTVEVKALPFHVTCALGLKGQQHKQTVTMAVFHSPNSLSAC